MKRDRPFWIVCRKPQLQSMIQNCTLIPWSKLSHPHGMRISSNWSICPMSLTNARYTFIYDTLLTHPKYIDNTPKIYPAISWNFSVACYLKTKDKLLAYGRAKRNELCRCLFLHLGRTFSVQRMSRPPYTKANTNMHAQHWYELDAALIFLLPI